MVVQLDVAASGGPSGMDPSTVRNGVIEPTEEAGIDFRQERS